MHRKQNIDRKHGDHLLRKRHLLTHLPRELRLEIIKKHTVWRYPVLILQQLDDFLNVFDPAVCCVSIHETERELRRRRGGKIGFVSLVSQHSDLIRFLFVQEAFVHIRNNRNDHLHSQKPSYLLRLAERIRRFLRLCTPSSRTGEASYPSHSIPFGRYPKRDQSSFVQIDNGT